MVTDDPEDYCESLPTHAHHSKLDIEENLIYWHGVEKAKRRFYI